MKWITDKETVEGDDAKEYWLCWVTTERSEQGPYYAGVTACYLLVNKSIRRGYKSMPEHVNMMDKSMKHHVIIDHIVTITNRYSRNFYNHIIVKCGIIRALSYI